MLAANLCAQLACASWQSNGLVNKVKCRKASSCVNKLRSQTCYLLYALYIGGYQEQWIYYTLKTNRPAALFRNVIVTLCTGCASNGNLPLLSLSYTWSNDGIWKAKLTTCKYGQATSCTKRCRHYADKAKSPDCSFHEISSWHSSPHLPVTQGSW